ncbi:unnamed protein product, partial [Didymodactylos carnosus]
MILVHTKQSFFYSNGLEPNFSIQDDNLLKRIKIHEYISSMKVDDDDTVELFLALSKLTLQASLYINEKQHQFTWIQLIKMAKTVSFTLLIKKYIVYAQVFEQFPFDVQAFIYSISSTSKFPLQAIYYYAEKLNLKQEELWYQFLSLFEKGFKKGQIQYDNNDIASLLKYISRDDNLFVQYCT